MQPKNPYIYRAEITAEQIREARRRKGFTQRELAEQLSVKKSLVGDWERDRGYPRPRVMVVLRSILDLPEQNGGAA